MASSQNKLATRNAMKPPVQPSGFQRVGTALKRITAAAALCLGAGSAHAVAYVGQWDPVYNPANALFGTSGSLIANLGWRGGFALDVDASCIPPASALNTLVFPSGLCTATMTAAFAEFYVTTDITEATIGRVDFLASSFNSGPLNSINSLLFSGNQLRNIATPLSAAAVASAPASSPLADPFLSWRLQFLIGSEPADYTGPSLSYQFITDTCLSIQSACTGSNSRNIPPTLRISGGFNDNTVPEPGALGLAALALALAAGARASKRKTQS
jgi:hypothetical protein